MKHQAAEELLNLPIVGSDKSKLYEEVQVLNINSKIVGTACNGGLEQKENIAED